MHTTMFAFAYDYLDEGVETVISNVKDRGGMDGVAVTSAYHAGRDFFPHNPKRKIRFLDAGTVFFQPDYRLYSSTGIRPVVAPEFRDIDMVRTVVDRAAAREMTTSAWTVYFHTDRGTELADFAPRNAFGDPYLTDICPLNRFSQEYALALTNDVASTGVESITAESLHFAPIEHGFHHERYFVPLTELVRYLLSICFCSDCQTAVAAITGLDGSAVRKGVAGLIDGYLEGDPQPDFSLINVSQLLGGELGGYLEGQRTALTALIQQVADTASEHNTKLRVVDLSGVVKGYATGMPTGTPSAQDAWKLGLDLAAVSRTGAVIEGLPYAKEIERVAFEIEGYRRILAEGAPLSVVIRHSVPDSSNAAEMAEKLALVDASGLDRCGFYCYGLVQLEGLDWIRSGLEALHER